MGEAEGSRVSIRIPDEFVNHQDAALYNGSGQEVPILALTGRLWLTGDEAVEIVFTDTNMHNLNAMVLVFNPDADELDVYNLPEMRPLPDEKDPPISISCKPGSLVLILNEPGETDEPLLVRIPQGLLIPVDQKFIPAGESTVSPFYFVLLNMAQSGRSLQDLWRFVRYIGASILPGTVHMDREYVFRRETNTVK